MSFNDYIKEICLAIVETYSEEDALYLKNILKLLIKEEEIDRILFATEHLDEEGLNSLMSCMEGCAQNRNAAVNVESYLMTTPMTLADEQDIVDIKAIADLKLINLYNDMYRNENPTE